MFTNQLSSIVNSEDKVTVNIFSVSPGIVLTNLGRYFVKEFGSIKKIAYYVFYPLVWFLMKVSIFNKKILKYFVKLNYFQESFDGSPNSYILCD